MGLKNKTTQQKMNFLYSKFSVSKVDFFFFLSLFGLNEVEWKGTPPLYFWLQPNTLVPLLVDSQTTKAIFPKALSLIFAFAV